MHLAHFTPMLTHSMNGPFGISRTAQQHIEAQPSCLLPNLLWRPSEAHGCSRKMIFSHKALSTVGRIQPDPSRGAALSVILPCLITILVQVHLAVIILINIVQVIFFFVMHL